MSGTANLNAPYIVASQNQKEVTHAQSIDRLDAAITEELAISVTAGNATPTAEQCRAAARIAITGATTAGRTVTLPAVQRPYIVSLDAASTKSVDIVRGSTAVPILPGTTLHLYADGTTNHLVRTAEHGVMRGALTIAGVPAGGEVLFHAKVPAGETWTLLPDLMGWTVEADDAATGTTVFDVTRNGSGVGTLSWAGAGTVPTLATGSNAAQAFTAGQVMRLVAESPADATLGRITIGMVIIRS